MLNRNGNHELLCGAIRDMTSLKYLNLSGMTLSDSVVSIIVANQEQNPSLTDINLWVGGEDYDYRF